MTLRKILRSFRNNKKIVFPKEILYTKPIQQYFTEIWRTKSSAAQISARFTKKKSGQISRFHNRIFYWILGEIFKVTFKACHAIFPIFLLIEIIKIQIAYKCKFLVGIDEPMKQKRHDMALKYSNRLFSNRLMQWKFVICIF